VTGADRVFTGAGEPALLEMVGEMTGFHQHPKFDSAVLDTYPYPAFDLQHRVTYIPILTSKGCPFQCSYCAASVLNPDLQRRSPACVLDEIEYWHKRYQVNNFVLYDDAFLVGSEGHALPILEHIVRKGLDVRFHTPNALHIREITREVSELLFKAGFTTLRLGLETADAEDDKRMDRKATFAQFKEAVSHLKQAGFTKAMTGAYILAGLPGQTVDAIDASLKTVLRQGVTPILAYYSPIPKTAMWEKACASARYDLDADPLFTNNSVFPCWTEGFSWQTLSRLKHSAGN
jgi:radical SAM superfamily enzyme YgiQ (UPF0313 family)